MRLINEIVTIILFLIISDVCFFIVSNKLNKSIEEKNKSSEEKRKENGEKEENIIKNIKLVFIVLFSIISLISALDLYNIIIKNINWNIHVLGIIKYSKVSLEILNTSFVFSLGQLLIYLNILTLLIFKSKKSKIILLILFILIYIICLVFRLYNVYDFYKSSKQYDYLKNYDIIADFKEDNEISDKGALKILQEELKFDYAKDVKFELTSYDEIKDNKIKYACDFENFWVVKFSLMRNYEIYENITGVVDLNTGECATIIEK